MNPSQSEISPREPAALAKPRRRKWTIAAIVAASLLVALLVVGLNWSRESWELRLRATAELAAVADMKMTQIMNWREERLGDGRFMARSRDVATDVRALLAEPAAEPTRTAMLERLTAIKAGERYEQVALYAADGRELLTVSSQSAAQTRPPAAEVEAALNSRGVALSDLHRDSEGRIHLNVLVPILPPDAGAGGEAKPLAAIIFRLDPERFLYPLIQQWPMPSRTGEVVLARREGDDLLFLNELRHRKGTALQLRLPISTPGLPMAAAMRGHPGIVEGIDYRGEPVVAVTYPIPDSPWFMAVKMDRAEIYAPLREQALNSGALALALTLAVLGGGAWLWRREEAAYLRRELAHEAALHASELKYRHYVNDAPLAIFTIDAQGRLLEANPACSTISGFEPGELIGQPFLAFVQPRHQQAGMAYFQKVLGGGSAAGSIAIHHKLGWEIILDFSAVRLSPDRVLCFGSDVTAQRKAEESLQLFRALVDRSSDAIEVIDPETGRFLDVNERGCADLAYDRAELLARHVWEIDPTLSAAEWPARVAAVREMGGRVFETLHRRSDGSTFPVEVNVRLVRLDREYLIAAVRDITERRQAEAQVRRLSVAIEQSPAAIVITDPSGTIEYVNPKFTEITGYAADEVLGKNPRILKSGQHPPEFYQQLWHEITQGRTWRGDMLNRRSNGELYWEHATIAPIADAKGRITQFVAIKEDVTERRRTENALRATQELFRELAENVTEVFWIMEPEGRRVLYISPAYERIWGRTVQSLHDDPTTWIEAIHPDDRERLGESISDRLAAGASEETYRILRPNGEVRWIHDRAFPVRDEAGRLIRIVGVARDVTESRALEAQYLQAQKMEAIGQLAGGVAHDFNNILSIMTIHSELLLDQLPEESPVREAMVEIQRAAERATALTRQLLVFSRRQIVEPKVLDLNATVAESEKMLRRLIGEDVRLATALAPGLWPVRIDPGHLTQVIMNLAVNARDAMPQGGQLTIETRNVELDEAYVNTHFEAQPGRYVLLTVADTGCGMTRDVLARIFEPFFTTKGVGHGTGLGLAVVHGIIKQAGGHLGVYSEPGEGTTFKIYLPALAEQQPATSSPSQAAVPRGSETILLVDDEESFRRVTATALEHLGYTVLSAASAAQALEIATKGERKIDLLLTDVVMPGMGGRVLAEAIRETRPDLKVLYQSGYTDDAIVRHGILQAEVAFIQKPFTLAALAAKVREVLDRPPSNKENG